MMVQSIENDGVNGQVLDKVPNNLPFNLANEGRNDGVTIEVMME